MHHLGIDVGTTRIKAVVYDDDRTAVAGEAAATTPVAETGDGAVHRPEEILAAVLDTAAEAVVAAAVTAVDSVAVASFGEEVVLVDDDGGVVADTLAWYNPRGSELAPDFLAEHGADLFRNVRPDPSFSLFKLLWIRKHRREELARCSRILAVGDFVTWTLGGGGADRVYMNWSHASRTGLFDPAARQWDSRVAAAAGISERVLPRLVPSGSEVGRLSQAAAQRIGVAPGAALVSGGHDHFCAAFAVGVREPGAAFVSAGTSEAILLLTASPPAVPTNTPVDIGCFVDDRHWYVHRAVPSGHFFAQWRQLLYGEAPDEVLYGEVEAAMTAANDDEVTVELDVAGMRLNLAHVALGHTRGDIMRALLEALASEAGNALLELERITGREADDVIVSGRATAHDVWRRMRATAFQRDLSITEQAEAAAIGAALVARAATSSTPDTRGPIGRTHHPVQGQRR